jgi:hypothetical protein
LVWDLQRAAAECRRHAAEFKREAQKAWLPSRRRYHLEMAESWLALAENYEFHLNLRRNIGELDELRAAHDKRAATPPPKDNAA